jgi:hypothetical protein
MTSWYENIHVELYFTFVKRFSLEHTEIPEHVSSMHCIFFCAVNSVTVVLLGFLTATQTKSPGEM